MPLHLSRFLKSVGDDCLHDHFEKQHPEIASTIDWASRGVELRRQLEQAVSEYPAVERHPRPLLERIDALAREPGDRAMVAVCNGNAAARARLNTLRSPQERAMWLLGHDSELFAHAEDIHYADFHSGGRSWSGFLGPVGRWPEATPDRLARFGSRLETVFRSFDGSGASVVVEPFSRQPTRPERHGGEAVFQLAIFLEGLPQQLAEFSGGRLTRRGLRPAVEVALTYASATGGIDVIAGAGKERRTEIAKAFVETMFPDDASLEPVRLREVELDSLLQTREFPTAPDDGIRRVRLVLARLAMPSHKGRITLEIGADRPMTLHTAARTWFSTHDPFAAGWGVTKAKLMIQFERRPSQRRGRSLPVELTVPNGCNLRDRTEEERLIGEKYLARWGLVRTL